MQHWDILLSNQVNKKKLIDNILNGEATGELAIFNTQKGILFSDIAIEKFIEKEFQYDSIEASTESHRQLRTFSSGERKKEFLKYCINQKPDFIIFDNPFDHLDQASRVVLADSLKDLTNDIAIIQLLNRTVDVLEFVPNKAQIKDNTFELHPFVKSEKHFKTLNTTAIPKATEIHTFPNDELIRLENVSVSYDERKILDNISWTIKQGEFWQLIGPNGSGKSTILSLITGDNPKGFGQDLFLFGRKKGTGESVWDIKKQIGIYTTAMMDLFQKGHTLEQMILSGFFDQIGLYTEPTTHQKNIVTQWLEVIEMTHLRKKRFIDLSIGQQRVGLIVRAVLKHPPLLILDEPVEGLDDENVDLVIQLINTIKQETNVSILYVSHRIEQGLAPTSVFELLPSETGSTGKIKN
ncbi:molybdate transport system ATP-binding protein [Flavobacterium nitrogenifigens]|uniref:Molybdate transport system ATP-binding protein n=2 Tax=Flavobacterium TaxID=237 RepID=A0A7W7N9F0_9FLAO|nr:MULTISPECIES: ATP-binding cassette domain-containing protein [Flavobacterium]MBB4803387.1 molybdate transport system ATP-binding protein [Flavobacterium nitrogenifigens]MBB6388345.1 molybdate transport system ATP-binding protein [Flavobacterium notoginsengisoli]